ncbi:MAG TPA: c-type cytochrome [Anaerolineales bacterium]
MPISSHRFHISSARSLDRSLTAGSINSPLPRVLSLLLLALMLSACSFSLAEDITPPPGSNLPAALPTQPALSGQLFPLTAPNPLEGAPIYAEKCAPCHGPTGLGDGPQAAQLPNPAPPLGSADLARQSTPAGWYSIITQGNLERFMPPFNSLTEGQRWDVVAYLYTLSSPPGSVAEGEQLYQANCVACHGQGGQGDRPEAGDLSVPPTDFTDQKRMAAVSGAELFEVISTGKAPDMPGFTDRLAEEERWALTAYLRSLTFASQGETAGLQETPPPETPGPEDSGTPVAASPELEVGTVSGKVVNLSGGDLPEGLEVTLHAYDDMQETATRTTTVLQDGSYTFTEVEMPLGRVYIVSVEFDQTIYGSDIAVVESGTTNLDLTVPVYETTSETASLAVDRLHIFFDYVEPDTLRVVEVLILSNLGDRTVVPASPGDPVFTFDLPPGAANLQFEDGVLGERYVEVPGGFGDTLPIRPGSGEHQVVFAYDMPYGRKLDLAQPLTLPVNAVVILVPEEGPKINSDLLTDEGTQPVQGMTYRMYSSSRLEAGTELSITISGRPRASSGVVQTGSTSSLIIGLGAFGLALVATGAWLYIRSRAGAGLAVGEEQDGVVLPGDDIPEDPEILMDAILALDDQYQAGELPEEAYRQRRAELKARLNELLAD